MRPASRLRSLLGGPGLVQAPGCFDAHTARLVAGAGFPCAYLTGFGSAASRIGAPDTGLLSFAEMADQAAAVAAAVEIPVIADADTGYGGPANVHRTVRTFARAGVAGVQVEDQAWPKRCGHTEGKEVVPLAEARARIRAAVDARAAEDIVLVARTDARAVLGLEAALERCAVFEEEGADVVFLEAPASREEMERLAAAVRAPLLVNVLEGGRTPVLPHGEYEAMGFRIAIYPLTLLYAVTQAVRAHLALPGGFRPWTGPLTFEELREIVGFPEHDRRVARWREGGASGTG